jgi:hypothetical protein
MDLPRLARGFSPGRVSAIFLELHRCEQFDKDGDRLARRESLQILPNSRLGVGCVALDKPPVGEAEA